MLYRSEAWCLREKEMAILRRTESYDSSDVWYEAIRSKKQREVDGHVGHKGVFR